MIRNHKSQKSVAACELSAKNRWALTGTPIQNKALDLYAIMKFLRVRPFDDLRVWKRWVDNKNEAGSKRLSTVMSAILLRRTKKELQEAGTMETMPEKIIDTIDIELNPSERIVYQKLLLYSQTLFAQFLHQQAEKKHMFELGVNYFDRPGNYSKGKFILPLKNKTKKNDIVDDAIICYRYPVQQSSETVIKNARHGCQISRDLGSASEVAPSLLSSELDTRDVRSRRYGNKRRRRG